MPEIKPQPGVLRITPYNPGTAETQSSERLANLANNESALGPSPHVAKAINEAAKTHLEQYPDSTCSKLRREIGFVHGLDPDRIVCTNGSEELINLVARAYATAGDEIVISRYGFLAYAVATQAAGASPVFADETNFRSNVDAIVAAVTDRTKIVFLANPNNPTGTYLPATELRRLRDEIGEEVILVIDAAYSEYCDSDDYAVGTDIVDNGLENTIVAKTFSKIYGLASARVGWAYAPASIVDVLHRVRGVWNVSGISQMAAIAAVNDQTHVARAREHNAHWLSTLSSSLETLGLTVTPSCGNFVLVHFGDDNQALEAYNHLLSRGVIVRRLLNYGLTKSLRISVGRSSDNELLLAALKDHLSIAPH